MTFLPSHLAVILTYHSQNTGGDRSPVNDHLRLAHDLVALTTAGVPVISLMELVRRLEEGEEPGGVLCLTFDDGCDLDVRDIDFPGAGVQRSFLGILEDFQATHDTAQPDLHATSFVIASQQARFIIDRDSLFAHQWMSDDWWAAANAHPLMSIGNHGWDHHHPDLQPNDPERGDFTTIADQESCHEQVVPAAAYIETLVGVWPEIFAYPFGQSSTYMREVYFPDHRASHRSRAALGAEPEPVTRESSIWNLPRYVCGRDWQSSEDLLEMISRYG